jgi:integrase
MPLTDKEIKNAKAGDRDFTHYDARGLSILVRPTGAKVWRFKYRFNGKANLLSLGRYPDVPLKLARERRDEARTLLASGVDPSAQRKSEAIAKRTAATATTDTFEFVAREWFAKFSGKWALSHSEKVIRRLERNLFPWIGSKPIADIEPTDVLACLTRIEKRTADTAHRAMQNASQVFRYAVATQRVKRDPTVDLRGALAPLTKNHFASITEPGEVGQLLRAIDGYIGMAATTAALKLAPLVFVRPGELRAARWADVDLDAAEWRYMVSKTKTAHIVPLSTQAVSVLRDLAPLTGRDEYVFPSVRSIRRPLSENTINAALRRLGYDSNMMTGHGFRAMARTILDEQLGFRPDFIEHQLAHAVRDPNGRAYNRTAHLPERRKMMQAWADYLGELRANACQSANREQQYD